jgi:hypothetical protein
MILESRVPGHEGECAPTWLNRNSICNRIDGGVSGFFRSIVRGRWFKRLVGREFHGLIRDGVVYSTASREGG